MLDIVPVNLDRSRMKNWTWLIWFESSHFYCSMNKIPVLMLTTDTDIIWLYLTSFQIIYIHVSEVN
jgi:hypothetical protein